MAKFSNIKIGQEVWSVQYGRGIIDEFARTDEGHKMFKVKFDNGDFEWYFENGKVNIGDANPTLFWNEFKIPSDDEDKKPFNLVEFLQSTVSYVEHDTSANNYFISYDYMDSRFNYNYSSIQEYIGVVYLDSSDLEYVVSELNEHNVTPQQLRQAYQALGWL